MKTKAYREWTDGIKSLTRSQRKSVFSQLNAVESQEAIIDELENNHVHRCPHCQGERLGRWVDNLDYSAFGAEIAGNVLML